METLTCLWKHPSLPELAEKGRQSKETIMKIMMPDNNRKKALFIIDCQTETLKSDRVKFRLSLISEFIRQFPYDAYVEAIYYADENSMFYKQQNFLLKREDAGDTAPEIKGALSDVDAKSFKLEKNLRSCFMSDYADDLKQFLKDNEIEECHFVGFDINACVFTSCFSAQDLGYFSYIIEELSDRHDNGQELRKAAIDMLRYQNMTNNSTRDKKREIEISILPSSFPMDFILIPQ